jgi:hypothetical protein
VTIRAAVAAHSRTPVDVLSKLTSYSKPAIRQSPGANPHTPLAVLKLLLAPNDADPEIWVRRASRFRS